MFAVIRLALVGIPRAGELTMEGQTVMSFEDRGSARLERLLADPERAERVAHIRQQIHADDYAYRAEQERLRNQ
ncbi:hypothetical protein M4D79_00340 [Mycolicibacterium novocastrense]|nr:hypothetical protein M4D79_00340 [Mycolicibacterium novocastrense]